MKTLSFIKTIMNDADFCTKGADSGSKMQEIVDYYSSKYEATGGEM